MLFGIAVDGTGRSDPRRPHQIMSWAQVRASSSSKVMPLSHFARSEIIRSISASVSRPSASGCAFSMKVLQDNNEGRVEIYRKPIGVVGSITPWNFPVMIASWHMIPASKTMVIKPSPDAPLATVRQVELINQNLPRGVANCVTGDDAPCPLMTGPEGIGKIVYTGSTGTGRPILAATINGHDTMAGLASDILSWLLGQFALTGLSMGGIVAMVLLRQAPDRVVRLASLDTNPRAELDELKARREPQIAQLRDGGLSAVMREKTIPNYLAEGTDAKPKGRVLLGGDMPTRAGRKPGYFLPLTIAADLKNGDRLVDEEQFEPVLPVIRYRDIDEAVDKANDLGGSVWSRDTNAAGSIAARLECGSVWINKHGAIQPNVPFEGVKQSGIGVEFGEDGLAEYTGFQAFVS